MILCLMGMGYMGKHASPPQLPYKNKYILTFNFLRSTLQCNLLKYCLLALLIKCKKARICGALLVVKYRASIKNLLNMRQKIKGENPVFVVFKCRKNRCHYLSFASKAKERIHYHTGWAYRTTSFNLIHYTYLLIYFNIFILVIEYLIVTVLIRSEESI